MNTEPLETSKQEGDDGIDLNRVDELVQKARAGDEAAFGELVKTYHMRVYGVAYRMVNHVDDAREVAQMSWVKAWNRLSGYKGDSKFFTWMYRLTVNTALDHIRQRTRKREVELPVYESGEDASPVDSLLVTQDTASDEMEKDDVKRAFHEALEALSPDHKAALILREVDGKTYQEIADAMGVRIGTVMSRIHYARKAIQERMRGVR